MNGLLPYDVPEGRLPELPSLDGIHEITLDTETNGLRWQTGDRPVGLAVAYGSQRRYLPFAHRGGGNLDEGTVKRWAKQELRGKHIVGFNTRFDVHMLRCWGADLRDQDNTFHDVSHAGCLLNDHRSKNRLTLQDFAEDELGEGKLDIGRPEHIADLPGSTVAPYAMRDVDLTQRLKAAFDPRLAAEDLLRVRDLEDACIPATVELESHGLPLDMETLHVWAEELPRIAERIIKDLHRACGFACTPSKKTDMIRLFVMAGVSYGRTPTGQAQFDADVLTAAAKRSPLILLAQRWLKVQHLLSKVIVPFLKNQINGILFPSFNQMLGDEGGTISGRYSSSNPNGQNLLNAGKYFRAYGWLKEYSNHIFLARALVRPERGVWWNGDQKQVEPRIAVHYTKSERLLQWYRDNPLLDIYPKVQDLIRPFRRDVTRDEAKMPTLAMLYGGGGGTVATFLDIDRSEADVLVDQYDTALPEFKDLSRRAQSVAETRGWVKTFLGRRCRFPGTPGHRQRTYKALNGIIQGTGADNAKQALVEVYKARKRLGVTLRVTEHDALGGDLEGPVEPVQALLNEQRMALSVPILWDVKTGATWAACKN